MRQIHTHTHEKFSFLVFFPSYIFIHHVILWNIENIYFCHFSLIFSPSLLLFFCTCPVSLVNVDFLRSWIISGLSTIWDWTGEILVSQCWIEKPRRQAIPLMLWDITYYYPSFEFTNINSRIHLLDWWTILNSIKSNIYIIMYIFGTFRRYNEAGAEPSSARTLQLYQEQLEKLCFY
jgi:hypothetical protein